MFFRFRMAIRVRTCSSPCNPRITRSLSLHETRIGPIAHDLAQGALLGARGNSGVILSQIWRGFARAMDNLETMDADLFVKGLIEAKNTAYKGVVRPVEGTILTVAKDIAAAAEEAAFESNDLMKVLEAVVDAANESVRRTPDLLPILKQAGVVDSGGKGLYIILEGMLRSSKGYSLETPLVMVQPLEGMNLQNIKESVEEGQDYEVVVDFKPEGNLDLHNFYEGLTEIGTSIQVGEGDGMYRMHIHVETDRRYEPIDYTMKYGTITKVAMENLIEQTGGMAQMALKDWSSRKFNQDKSLSLSYPREMGSRGFLPALVQLPSFKAARR